MPPEGGGEGPAWPPFPWLGCGASVGAACVTCSRNKRCSVTPQDRFEEKLQAEKYLRASGLDYTIVRPGGLSDEPASAVGNIIVRGEDTLFGLDDDPGRAISRDTVAEVCVEALIQPGASNRVVEVVASPTAPPLGAKDWFASL